jgi:hypothetical protein
MAVALTDLHLYRSVNGASDGGTISPTEILTGVKNSLWPNLSDAERTAGGNRTKKYFLVNEHATDALAQPKLWIGQVPAGFLPDQLGIGWNDADDDSAFRGNMTALDANAQIELVSDGPDTRTITLLGLDGSGTPITEDVVLTGTTPVLSVATFSVLYAAKASAENATNTVTLKQGSGGTTRGTIDPSTENCWLWVAASSEASAIKLPDLVAGGSIGIWHRQEWPAGVTASRPAESRLRLKEGI